MPAARESVAQQAGQKGRQFVHRDLGQQEGDDAPQERRVGAQDFDLV